MKHLKKEIRKCANKNNSEKWSRYFKIEKGGYAEGDIILGICVPKQREIAKKFGKDLSIINIQELLDSKFHEERMTGLLILIEKFSKGNCKEKEFIFNFYLKNTRNINHWDLVDLSAPKIIGEYLLKQKDRKILVKLAKSKNLWERRIAIISTFIFIKKGKFKDTLVISELLLNDSHDLIHKAVGWMLREVGKKEKNVLENFLKENYNKLPRTTLRYAIERFPEDLRKRYLLGDYETY